MTKDEALDLALEELENCADLLKVFDAPIDSCVGASMLQAEKAITAIKQARSAPVQEPTDSMGMPLSCGKPLCAPGDHHPLCKLATPPAQPAPVQECLVHGECFGGKCIYTTPPAAQRQWVGLTDEEILKLAYPLRWQEVDDFEADKAVNFAQLVEAKLKEKNT
jgi:hypothetical protein